MTKAAESKMIVGLEIGTSKVVSVVGEVLPDGVVNVLGVGSSPSKGMNKGSITDLDAVVNSVQRAIEAAESIADCKIISVTLAITGAHITTVNEYGQVTISGEAVTAEDVDSAIYSARSVKLADGLEMLHVIPQEYSVDKQHNIKNPIGFSGVRLQSQAHLIACHQDWLRNLKKSVEKSKLKVDQIVFSGLASSYSVLTEDEKELGVCLVDIGGGTMDILVYTDGALRFSKVIPYAGDLVTDDIAYACTTSRQDAENIKINFGSAISPPTHSADKKIEVPGVGGRMPTTLTKNYLSMVTSARYHELLKLVEAELTQLKNELFRKQVKSELIAGIVLTGGGSQIEDIVECAKSIFGPQVRVGYPLNVTGLTDYVNKPQYATVLGLLQYSYHNNELNSVYDAGKVSDVIDKAGGWLRKFVQTVKSNF